MQTVNIILIAIIVIVSVGAMFLINYHYMKAQEWEQTAKFAGQMYNNAAEEQQEVLDCLDKYYTYKVADIPCGLPDYEPS